MGSEDLSQVLGLEVNVFICRAILPVQPYSQYFLCICCYDYYNIFDVGRT